MISVLQTFPISYEDMNFDPYEGLMSISPKAAGFYNRLFGMELVSGESTPLGEDESMFDEQVPATALGLTVPKNKKLAPGGAFLVKSLDEAKKVLADQKISIIKEDVTNHFRLVIVSDPDKNPIVIFSDIPKAP